MSRLGQSILGLLLSLAAVSAWAGVTSGNNPHANSPSDRNDCPFCYSPPTENPNPTPPTPQGMPVYWFKALLASLHIQDTPVGYTPPVGPAVKTTLSYNERETDQPATFDSYNVGHKWTLNWLTYIQDDPNAPGVNVMRYVAGGGGRTYSGFDPSSGAFAPEEDNGAHLVMTSSNPITYELRFRDGSKDVFSASDGKTTYPRKVFITRMVDARGNAITFRYDSALRLSAITDAIGQATTFRYDDVAYPLQVTSITDPFGRSAKLVYDSQGRLISITDVIGMTSTFTYDSGTFVKSMTTPYGTTAFAHTEGVGGSTELSIQATDPLGYSQRAEYRIAAPGVPFSMAHVPAGMEVFNAYQNYRDSFYWNKDAYAAACTESNGQVSCDYSKARMDHFEHQYPCCELTSRTLEDVKNPLESTIWYAYAGQPGPYYPGRFDRPSQIGRVLPDGTTQLTSYEYNSFGRVTETIDPAGRQTVYTYAPNGIDLLTVQQKNGSGFDTIAQFTYNGQHEPLTYTDAAGQTTRYTYNARGQRTSITNPLGQTTTYHYDSNGYLVAVINPLGHVQHRYTYDAYGRLASATDSQGYTLRFRYDALNRLTRISYPDRTHEAFTWNKLDLASFTDRLGNTTTFAYDADRNLIAMTDPMGHVTRYTYYPNGEIHTLTDPNGDTTNWTRDLEGRVIAKTYSDGSETTFAYDTANRLIRKTDALGQITRYAYTVADRLAGIDYANALNPTPAVNFAYDTAYPRLVSMSDGEGSTAFSYYPAGVLGADKLKSEQGPDAHDSLSYTYDALGRVASRTVDGTQETYRYDALGRRVGDDNALGEFTTAYLGDTNQPTLRTVAGVPYRVRYRYEGNLGDRRLKGILNETWFHGRPRPVVDYAFTSNDDWLFLSRAERMGGRGEEAGEPHGWEQVLRGDVRSLLGAEPDGDGWRARDEDRGRGDDREGDDEGEGRGPRLRYSYDGDLRLTRVRGRYRERYAYDPADNLTEADTAGGSTAFAVNDLNEIVSAGATGYRYDADGNLLDDGHETFGWDAAGRLVTVTDKASGHTSHFAYDGFSRRVQDTETDPSGVTVVRKFLWCGLRLCEKRDAGGRVLARYFPQGELQGGQVLYYAQDQVGSVAAVVNAAGRVVGRLRYDSYGNLVGSRGTLPDFRYAGLYYHQPSGLELATYRAYDPLARRWISRDPIGLRGGNNAYLYVTANPLNYTDPYGLLLPGPPCDPLSGYGWCPGGGGGGGDNEFFRPVPLEPMDPNEDASPFKDWPPIPVPTPKPKSAPKPKPIPIPKIHSGCRKP